MDTFPSQNLTANSIDTVYEQLLKEYEFKGVPTIIFLDRQGIERSDLRLIDFIPTDQFLIRIAEARKPVMMSNNGNEKEFG